MKTINLFFYAPNVHTGGGLVLLKDALSNFPTEHQLKAILDNRCKNEIQKLNLSNLTVIYWVKPNFFSRALSEITLLWSTKRNEHVFCFHNIPPILCKSNNITIFFQNRLILENKLRGLIRKNNFLIINLERFIIKNFYKSHMKYITQTTSIKSLLWDFLSSAKKNPSEIRVLPFYSIPISKSNRYPAKKWNFLYVTSDDLHKNNKTLFDAWKILKNEGLTPSLAVTIRDDDSRLLGMMESSYANLNIINLGKIDHSEVMNNYQYAEAFIHPSMSESFPLALTEANYLNLPILAPELDYVRDICTPNETFDPNSPLSIARAVMRFMKKGSTPEKPLTSSEFWKTLLKH